MNLIPTIVRYPIWFFIDNYSFWMKFYRRTLILLNDALGLKSTLLNLFKPYRKDRTVVGVFIGIVVRGIYSLAAGGFLLMVFVFLTGSVMFYFTLPFIGFLLAISISDYIWVNFLGVALWIIPFVFYLVKKLALVPSLTEDGYPKKWEKFVFQRLLLNPEAARAAKENETFDQFLKERKLTSNDYEIAKQWIAHKEWQKQSWKYWEDDHFSRFVGTNLGWVSGWMRESKYFTRDLTQDVLKRKIYNWLGMDEIIDRVLTVLTRDQHNNILLVGDPGVGKTSVVYAIAKRMNAVGGYSLIDLNVAGLLSGGGQQGEFERKFNATIKEFQDIEMILVIENIEQLLEAGVAQYFYPTLQSGDFPIIATTTHTKLRDVLEKEGTFLNAFESIAIPEPDTPDVLFILQEKVPHLETKYGVFVSYQALRATVELAAQYIVDRAFPSKAIDLLEETCASVQSGRFQSPTKDKKIVTREHVEEMVTEITGVAVGTVSENEADKLIQLEKLLHERIVGQDEAVQEIAAAMRRARSGLSSGERPLGSFLFLGPTGVGKTQTAKIFAEIYFGSQNKMVRVDMSEYSEFGVVERFLDYISDQIRTTPFSVVLLDEFEKADRKIHNLFLQVLEDGIITDTHGNVADFKNSIIIATSNAVDPENDFSPELRNRFDGLIRFTPLEASQVEEITKIELADLVGKMAQKEIAVQFTQALISAVAQKGFDPAYGARPVRRAIQDFVENPLADALIKEDIQAGDSIVLDWRDDHLVIRNAS